MLVQILADSALEAAQGIGISGHRELVLTPYPSMGRNRGCRPLLLAAIAQYRGCEECRGHKRLNIL